MRLVRKCFKDSMDEGDFEEWNLDDRKGAFSNHNKLLSQHIVDSVKGLHPDLENDEIENAVRINFRSKKDTKRKTERNPNYLADCASTSRKETKLNRRLMTLKKFDVDQPTKTAIQTVLCPAMMSSEDEDIQDGEKSFIVRRPSWRAEGVAGVFEKLDQLHKDSQSKHSRYRSLKRCDGPPSDRQEPVWSDKIKKAIDYFN
uniref:Uncharacterized protein n=1 Tax=Clytia hemisphaerica TaxID=252671 RepID=A0A7M5UQL9_9CNID